MGKRKNIKKAVKAQVEEEARQQQKQVENLDIETNLEDVMSMDTEEGGMTPKEKRQEVRKRVKEAKSKVTMKGPFYKMSQKEFGALSVKTGQDDNPSITKADFVVNATKKTDITMMSDLKKHCYNSKKKKK